MGFWRTPAHRGVVEIVACGASICGRAVTSAELVATPDLRDQHNPDLALRGRRLAGLVILQGFTRGSDAWTGGRIYNPEDGRTYHARITVLDPTHLRLRGCVFVPMCRSEVWTRSDEKNVSIR